VVQGTGRTLKKPASLSCSFGLFGLSGLSGLFGLSRLFGFSGSSNKTNQIDQTNQTDQITRQTGLVPDVRAIEFQERCNSFFAAYKV